MDRVVIEPLHTDAMLMMNRAASVEPETIAANRSPTRLEVRSPKRRRSLLVRHLLLPLDGSALAETVLGPVSALAKATGARVTLLRVLEPAVHQSIDAFEWEIARSEVQGYLARVQAELVAEGIDADIKLLDGRASEQIVHFAASGDFDTVAVASHGQGGGGQWPLSGTAHKVVTGTPSSVLIVPARGQQGRTSDTRPRKILLGLDCSQRAECILPTAIELAQQHDAELLLVHVVPEPELPRRLTPSTHDIELARQVTESNQREAQHYLRELQQRLARDSQRLQVRTVVSSHTAKALSDLAREEQVDLVIVAAHGGTGDATRIHGSVAAALLHDVSQPLLIVQDLSPAVMQAANTDPDQAAAATASDLRRP